MLRRPIPLPRTRPHYSVGLPIRSPLTRPSLESSPTPITVTHVRLISASGQSVIVHLQPSWRLPHRLAASRPPSDRPVITASGRNRSPQRVSVVTIGPSPMAVVVGHLRRLLSGHNKVSISSPDIGDTHRILAGERRQRPVLNFLFTGRRRAGRCIRQHQASHRAFLKCLGAQLSSFFILLCPDVHWNGATNNGCDKAIGVRRQ